MKWLLGVREKCWPKRGQFYFWQGNSTAFVHGVTAAQALSHKPSNYFPCCISSASFTIFQPEANISSQCKCGMCCGERWEYWIVSSFFQTSLPQNWICTAVAVTKRSFISPMVIVYCRKGWAGSMYNTVKPFVTNDMPCYNRPPFVVSQRAPIPFLVGDNTPGQMSVPCFCPFLF